MKPIPTLLGRVVYVCHWAAHYRALIKKRKVLFSYFLGCSSFSYIRQGLRHTRTLPLLATSCTDYIHTVHEELKVSSAVRSGGAESPPLGMVSWRMEPTSSFPSQMRFARAIFPSSSREYILLSDSSF